MAAFAHLIQRIPRVDDPLRILCVRRGEHRRADVAQCLREREEGVAVLADSLLGFLGGQVALSAVIFELRAFLHDVAAVHHEQVRAFREDDRLATHLGPLLICMRLLLGHFAFDDGRADGFPQKVGGRIDHAGHDILDAGDRLQRRG